MSILSPEHSRAAKIIIKPHKESSSNSVMLANIFSNPSSACVLDTINSYSIVGDSEFKKAFFQSKETKEKDIELQHSDEKSVESAMKTKVSMKFQESLRSNGSFEYSKERELEMTRPSRTLMEFSERKKRNQTIAHQMLRKTKRTGNSTITYSQKEIELFPNPEFGDLMNENIPQFWERSLRENDKQLQKHVKGAPFRIEAIEEMLQTVKGRKKLSLSIPKIEKRYLGTVSKLKEDEKIALKGKRVCSYVVDQSELSLNKNEKDFNLMYGEVYKVNYNGKNKLRNFGQ